MSKQAPHGWEEDRNGQDNWIGQQEPDSGDLSEAAVLRSWLNPEPSAPGAPFVAAWYGAQGGLLAARAFGDSPEQALSRLRRLGNREAPLIAQVLRNGTPSRCPAEGPDALTEGCFAYACPIAHPDGSLTCLLLLVAASDARADTSETLGWLAASFAAHCRGMAETARLRRRLAARERNEQARLRRDLFQAAKRLHAMIDVDSVLDEIVHSLKLAYPSLKVAIFLSQDNVVSKVSVRPLNFQSEEPDICIRAFVEGRSVHETAENGRGETAAFPLQGKQGIYGVLRVDGQPKLGFAEMQYIANLAETAGIAFENARLYQQSNILIDELRLINEITKRLNQSLKLNDIFTYACHELIKIFDADFCLVLELDPGRRKFVVQACNIPLFDEDLFDLRYGFSGKMLETKEAVIVSDYRQSKVESKLMEETRSRSMIASPVIIKSEVVGVILVTHRKPHFFSYDNYKLLQVLSSHIGLAISNASLHAEVRRMAITDHLTRLHSRHYLDEQIGNKMKVDFCGSLILLDIDNFKSVNDTYGHQIGDKVLVQVSDVILTSIRDTDIAARWGGEELAMYLPQANKEQALRVAERIRTRVLIETEPGVTVSCGVSDWKWEDEQIGVENLFYRADMALYEAKKSGKNTIRFGK